MKKASHIFQKRINFKYLTLILVLLCAGLFLLFKSFKNESIKKIHKKDNTTEIKRLIEVADNFYFLNNLDSAFINYNKILPLCNLKKHTEDYVYAIYSISYIYNDKSDFVSSESTAILALPYLKDLKKTRHAWIVYTLLGSNYSNMFDSNNAMIYYKKSKALKTTAWRKGIAINNIASVYMNQKKYLEAIKLLQTLLSPEFRPETEESYGYAVDNLGYCYFKTGEPKKALYYFQKGLKFRLQPNKKTGIENSYIHLSMFFEKRNMPLAKQYAKKAYNESTANSNALDQVNSLALLIKTSEGTDLKNYSLRYIKRSDSLINARQKAKNQFANIKYNFNIDKTENLQLKAQKAEDELQLERQKSQNIFSYIIILLTAASGLFIYFYLTTKGKKEKDQAIFESEMRISKKLSDQLANEVHRTITFSENRNLEIEENKEQLLNNLDAIYFKTRNISKENSSIITDKKYSIALKEMISGFKTSDVTIFINGFDLVSWNEMDKNKKIILYRILQELFGNMKKHSKATLVSLSFKITGKKLTIIYTDNGTGTENKSLNIKNGLQNVESRIKTINGNIIFDNNSEKSFRLSFSFPL